MQSTNIAEIKLITYLVSYKHIGIKWLEELLIFTENMKNIMI